MKVLPELMKSVEFGGGGPKAINVTLKIASKLPSDDFESKMIPFVVRIFGNPDRAVRVCLLDSLPLIIERLPQKIVNDKIFPQLVRDDPYSLRQTKVNAGCDRSRDLRTWLQSYVSKRSNLFLLS